MGIKQLKCQISIFQSFWNILLISFILLGLISALLSCFLQIQYIAFIANNELFSIIIAVLLSAIKIAGIYILGLMLIHKYLRVLPFLKLCFFALIIFLTIVSIFSTYCSMRFDLIKEYRLLKSSFITYQHVDNKKFPASNNKKEIANLLKNDILKIVCSMMPEQEFQLTEPHIAMGTSLFIALIFELITLTAILSALTFFSPSFQLAFKAREASFNMKNDLLDDLKKMENQEQNVSTVRYKIEKSLKGETKEHINTLN